jgi:hypothetical protein
MRALRHTAFAAISALLAASGASAHNTVPATNVSIKVTGINSDAVSVPLSRLDLLGGVAAGQLTVQDAAGQSFAAYCVELSQVTSDKLQSYTVGSFTGTQATQLQGLFSATSLYSGAAAIDSSLEYAAFQVAVWEITQETSAKRDVSFFKGGLYVAGLGSTDLSVAAKANSYLADALAYKGPALFALDKLGNSRYQDLVRATALSAAVPELNRPAMMAMGLGLMAVVVRRRRVR